MNEHRPVALWWKPTVFLSFLFHNFVCLFVLQVDFLTFQRLNQSALASVVFPGCFEVKQSKTSKSVITHAYAGYYSNMVKNSFNFIVWIWSQLCVKWDSKYFGFQLNFKARFMFSTSHTCKLCRSIICCFFPHYCAAVRLYGCSFLPLKEKKNSHSSVLSRNCEIKSRNHEQKA